MYALQSINTRQVDRKKKVQHAGHAEIHVTHYFVKFFVVFV